MGTLGGQEAATEDPVVLERAHEYIVLFFFQFFLAETQSQRLSQHLKAQTQHLLILGGTVINQPERHEVMG